MMRWSFPAVLMLLIVLAACGGGSTNEPSLSEAETHPLNVSVSEDSERKVSQTVGPDGGTLTTTGPDGTQFTLEIPKDAIPVDTVVSMTPLSSVDGLPFSQGLVGGVQFGPDGLRLQQPALLTVDPAHPVPVAEQAGFAYSGTGQDFHLAPLSLRTDVIQVQVFGFSGAGVGHGGASEASAVIPASPFARLQQKIADAIQRDREQGRETLSAEAIQIIEDAMAEYQAYLDPLMTQAEKDCALALRLVPEQLALERQRQLLGFSSDSTAANMWTTSTGKALNN